MHRAFVGVILALALAVSPCSGAVAGATPLAGDPFGGVDPLGGQTSLGNAIPLAEPAALTINSPPARSKDTKPSFSGTAAEAAAVTVEVFEGTSTEGKPVRTLKAAPSGGDWASASVSPPLADGTYAALATQPSGEGTLRSSAVSFEVDTKPPTVTLAAPPSPSNDTTPSLSGTASEATRVTVEIFRGARPEGLIAATASATPGGAGASWSSDEASPALMSGTYTALATEPSALGNEPGVSAPVTFVVDTEPPALTLVSPRSPSNDTRPSFSGTASEATRVTIEIFEGTRAEGRIAASATAAESGGSFSSDEASPALADGTYTALASQPSAIGNLPGHSAPVTFMIDTAAPVVTLNALPTPSGDAAPSFSGTASDHTDVTVDIYSGAGADGTLVASVNAEAGGGEWVSGKLSRPLDWGQYTAEAIQPSSLGNPAGTSASISFAVEPIAPTVVTEAASDVTRTAAALYASVDPAGGGVGACYFEYGTTSAYGTQIECGFVSGAGAFPPAGTAAVPVFARIYGLRAGLVYHFRIVAVGEGGTGYGADQSFTMLPPFSFDEAPAHPAPAPSGAAHPPSISAARTAAMLVSELRRLWRGARIAALLRTGAYRTHFSASEAGSARFDWYYTPPDYTPPAHRSAGRGARAARTMPAKVLVAAGTLRLHAAGSAALTIRLTRQGRRLLEDSRQLRLTAWCRFTPGGARSVSASAALELAR